MPLFLAPLAPWSFVDLHILLTVHNKLQFSATKGSLRAFLPFPVVKDSQLIFHELLHYALDQLMAGRSPKRKVSDLKINKEKL